MAWTTGKDRTGTAWWKATCRRILARDQHRCTWMDNGARCTQPATDVDHVISEANGGSHDDNNLRSLCAPHHRKKTAAEGVAARSRYSRKRPVEKHPGLR